MIPGSTRHARFTKLAIAFSAAMAINAVQAQPTDIIINGTPVAVDRKSVKCDLGEIEKVSKRRLVNCNSAKLIELSYGGEKSSTVKFTIDPFDEKISDGVRAELRDMHEAGNGDETWYRFSTLLPEDFPVDAKHRLVLSQWHERVREGQESLRPPLSHRLWNGRFVVTLWNKERIEKRGMEGDGEILFDRPELERGIFHEFVYKILWSPEKDGTITGWTRKCPILTPACEGSNWTEIIRYEGATGYDSSKIKSYYFKLGLYTVTDFEVPFTAYHRNYRVGGSAQEIGLVDGVFE